MDKTILVPNTVLSLATTGVSTANGVAATASNIFTFTVPDGEVLAIGKYPRLKLKLYDDVTPTEMPRDTVFAFGLKTTLDPNRVVPLGHQMLPYTNWLDLSLAEQGHDDYIAQTTINITRQAPMIVVDQDETFVVQVYSAAGTLYIASCVIEIPVFRAPTGSIIVEKAWRMLEIAR